MKSIILDKKIESPLPILKLKECNFAIHQNAIFKASSAAMLLMDDKYNILSVNPAFSKISGYSFLDLKYKNIHGIFDLFVNLNQHQDIIANIEAKGHWKGDLMVQRKENDCFDALVFIDLMEGFENESKSYIVLLIDISDIKQLENELRFHAENDPLTNLANRKLFFQCLDNSIALAKRFNDSVALLFLDLDGFKQINDHFGHGQGDKVLVEVAQRLRGCVREVDTIARLGGDEFVIILNRTSKSLVSDTAQRIIDRLTLKITDNDCELAVSASIGIAIYPDDSVNPMTLLKYADAAMYNAKLNGKHQFCWHTSL